MKNSSAGCANMSGVTVTVTGPNGYTANQVRPATEPGSRSSTTCPAGAASYTASGNGTKTFTVSSGGTTSFKLSQSGTC